MIKSVIELKMQSELEEISMHEKFGDFGEGSSYLLWCLSKTGTVQRPAVHSVSCV